MNGLIEMTELLLQHDFIDKDVWIHSGEIMTSTPQESDNLYIYMYRHETGLTNPEREKLVKLFEKYGYKIQEPKLKTSQAQIGY